MRNNKLIPSFEEHIVDYSVSWLGFTLFIWKDADIRWLYISGYGIVDWDGTPAFHTPWFTAVW